MSAITLATLNRFKADRKRFSMLTAYDASFAAAAARAGVASVLVGDSLGMVVQGGDSTVSVTIENMAYHTACVARGIAGSKDVAPLIVADLPLGTYYTPEAAGESAATLMRAGANVVKLEGGAWLADTVRFLTERGVPVCAHLGLTPQTADMLGGYKVQGRDETAARRIRDDAAALEAAGARLMVLECVPNAVGAAVASALSIPVIGIGAGPGTDAQVLVMHDMLGVSQGRKPRFVKDYMAQACGVEEAFRAFAEEVESGDYPAPEHCYG
ncbi:3-methyl-2-oxobutanoate hydroxymethyltransferase [Stappia sp. ES.058]|uniref:3-methyl-2-oxobutanoate hydroxymethyltransferase n=1 Tax=Stappia sp. ES.058 TaxID=1881061 RepID=UPI00087D0BC3|nr:3-methyl-2-oxobutanoate hydroxymethyltransferase [Stappia sp. ES.058]SDU47677.1 ketopantoate hydroxymethyltransferase [Stappia sp. ES.058]